MRLFILIIFTLLSIRAQAQDSTRRYTDSNGVKWIEHDDHKMWSIHQGFRLYGRIGVGIQKSFYSELGISILDRTISSHNGILSYGFYASGEWTPKPSSQDYIYGIKIGTEGIGNIFGGAIELKYQWDKDSSDFVITPKYGISGAGYFNIFYGYNISVNKYPFKNKIRCHQISLVFNLNRKMFNETSKIPR